MTVFLTLKFSKTYQYTFFQYSEEYNNKIEMTSSSVLKEDGGIYTTFNLTG